MPPRARNAKSVKAPKPINPGEMTQEEINALPKFNVSLLVHSDFNNSRVVDLGQNNEIQISNINTLIMQAFEDRARTTDLFLTDANGAHIHFNILKIISIEVRVVPVA